jgi:beta-lactamase superfamily II metal-dependent hydrolase
MLQREEQIARLQQKLQKLVKQHQLLQKENLQLKKDLEKQRQNAAVKQEQINLLQQQSDALKVGAHGWDNESKKDFEKRIDLYLKEVERCLALLNA